MDNTSYFKVQNINQEFGFVEVRFINFLGPIFTGQKVFDDFKKKIKVPTGSFSLEGEEIFEEKEIMITDNPNEDLIYSIDIPLDENGQFVDQDQLLQHIARHYPREQFMHAYKAKMAPVRSDLEQLKDSVLEVSIAPSTPSVAEETVAIDIPIENVTVF